MRRRAAKTGVALCLGAAMLAATARSTYADETGAFTAGVIGGTALGLLALGGFGAYPAQPTPYAVEPIVGGPPARCHEVLAESFDPSTGAYVEATRMFCEDE